MINRPIYVDKIMAYVNTPFVKILTGIRRCGKSTILRMLMEEMKKRGIRDNQILHYSFDSLEYEDIKTAKTLFTHLKQHLCPEGRTYLFLDEIQEVKSWEKVVNSLMTDYDVDIYVTGSNSRMMSSEISTYLTGRYIAFRIFPLSFSEYMIFRKEYTEVLDPRTELANYLRLGGFPAVHLQKYTPNEVYTIVKDIYSSTIYTDIVRRNQIRKVDQLERIVKFAFDNVGRTFSAASISKYLKSEGRSVSPETVLGYIKACTDAFLFYQVKRQDLQGKKILTVNEKYYVADHGIREAVFGGNKKDINLVLENIVYMELLRRGYTVTVGKVGSKEIDFVCEDHGNKLYVQVAYLLASEDTIQREFGVYDHVRDNFPKYVVTLDEFDMSRDGIKHRNIRDFLLEDEWN